MYRFSDYYNQSIARVLLSSYRCIEMHLDDYFMWYGQAFGTKNGKFTQNSIFD